MYLQAALDAVIEQTEARTLRTRLPLRNHDPFSKHTFSRSIQEVASFLRMQRLFEPSH
jgi:hypothetical protein